MIFNFFSAKRPFLAPDVVQSSFKDSGAASLKAILKGFGISIRHDRLREALYTDTEATSIDILEQAAVQLGLEVEQVMVPAEHLLLPEAQTLPAIVVVRQPNGWTHFVVAWRQHGPFIQLMDPSLGRRWLTRQHFLDELYIHTLPVSARRWQDWAASEEFQKALYQRLTRLSLKETDIARLMDTALDDPGWHQNTKCRIITRFVAIPRLGLVSLGRSKLARGANHPAHG